MSGENINFSNKKFTKKSFYKNKKLFKIDIIDVNKGLVLKKESNYEKGSIILFWV